MQNQWIFITLLALGGAAFCGESDTETEALVKKLSSEDFDEREKAAMELGKRAEKIWPRLEELARSSEADVRTLARRAMCEAGKRALVPYTEALEEKIVSIGRDMKDAEEDFSRLGIAYDNAVAAEKEAIEKRIIDPNDTHKEREKAAEKAKDAALVRCIEAQGAKDKRMHVWRLEHATLQSRLLQLRQFIASNEPILPADIPTWTPAKLPFGQRLNCKVTFEFVDLSLVDALAWMSDVCGAKFELSAKVLEEGVPSVNLRVTDMQASLAVEWIGKLADLEFTVDHEKQKVLLHKPK